MDSPSLLDYDYPPSLLGQGSADEHALLHPTAIDQRRRSVLWVIIYRVVEAALLNALRRLDCSLPRGPEGKDGCGQGDWEEAEGKANEKQGGDEGLQARR